MLAHHSDLPSELAKPSNPSHSVMLTRLELNTDDLYSLGMHLMLL